MRSIIASLSRSVDKVSEIDKKISQIDKKEPENTSIDNVRSMLTSLSQSIDTDFYQRLIKKYHKLN